MRGKRVPNKNPNNYQRWPKSNKSKMLKGRNGSPLFTTENGHRKVLGTGSHFLCLIMRLFSHKSMRKTLALNAIHSSIQQLSMGTCYTEGSTRCNITEHLNFSCALYHLGGLVKMWVLTHQIWDGDWDSWFLTRSQMMLILLVSMRQASKPGQVRQGNWDS